MPIMVSACLLASSQEVACPVVRVVPVLLDSTFSHST